MHQTSDPNRLVVLMCLCLCAAAIGGIALAENRPAENMSVVPGVPQNVQASHDQPDYIKVSWDAVPQASNYQVLRADSEFGTYTVVSGDVVPASPWQDMWALSGKGYWYKVRACSLAGCGTRSEAASGYRNGPPLPPTHLVASKGITTDTVSLRWDASVGAIDYQIRRNTVNDPEGAWAVVRTSSLQYDDHPPAPDTAFWYWVTARSAKGASRDSEPDRGYCGDEPPDWQITPTPTRTVTRYATATDAPPTGTLTPTMTPSAPVGSDTATPTPTPTVGSDTVTPTPTPTPTRTSSMATPTRTESPESVLVLPIVHK